MAAASDTEVFLIAAGDQATRTVPNVDEIEPELVEFVRRVVRWLDPDFPETGERGTRVRGDWLDDQQIQTEFVQVQELAPDGRGLRILRLYRVTPPGGPYEGAVRVVAEGLATGARLELRWNFVASHLDVRGTSAELTVDGPGHLEVVEAFRGRFEPIGN